jgi:hypothetical protein
MNLIDKLKAKTSPKNQFKGRLATLVAATLTYVATEADDVKIKLIAGALAAGFAAIARKRALKIGTDENE